MVYYNNDINCAHFAALLAAKRTWCVDIITWLFALPYTICMHTYERQKYVVYGPASLRPHPYYSNGHKFAQGVFGDFVPVIVYSFFWSVGKSFISYVCGLTLTYTVS